MLKQPFSVFGVLLLKMILEFLIYNFFLKMFSFLLDNSL